MGDDDEALKEMLGQAYKGIDKGFSDARKELDKSGVLTDPLKEGIDKSYDLIQKGMNDFEDEILKELPDVDGYLNIGRETYKSLRTIFFACKEFRRSSKTMTALIDAWSDKLNISYEIFKDKYWMTVNHLKQ